MGSHSKPYGAKRCHREKHYRYDGRRDREDELPYVDHVPSKRDEGAMVKMATLPPILTLTIFEIATCMELGESLNNIYLYKVSVRTYVRNQYSILNEIFIFICKVWVKYLNSEKFLYSIFFG